MSLTSRFSRREPLGKGAFGEVYAAVRKTDLKRYAVKVLRVTASQGGSDMAVQEIAIHEKLKHCNILEFVEAITLVKEIHLVFELCGEGTILDFLYNAKSDNRPLQLSLIAQICAGVHYLHEGWSATKNIIHRDLKLENILITSDFRAKISDFGLAMEMPKGMQGIWGRAGTPGYMSPEMTFGRAYSTKTDIWSLGCVVYEILTLGYWSDGNGDPGAEFVDISNKLSVLSMPERSIVKSMLNKNPRFRASAGALLAHPFIMEHLQSPAIFDHVQSKRSGGLEEVPLSAGQSKSSLQEINHIAEISFATAAEQSSRFSLHFQIQKPSKRSILACRQDSVPS